VLRVPKALAANEDAGIVLASRSGLTTCRRSLFGQIDSLLSRDSGKPYLSSTSPLEVAEVQKYRSGIDGKALTQRDKNAHGIPRQAPASRCTLRKRMGGLTRSALLEVLAGYPRNFQRGLTVRGCELRI